MAKYDFSNIGKETCSSNEIKILSGTVISKNLVPEHTSGSAARPFLVFQDAQTGKKFGISKSLLVKNILLTGAPGTGKTSWMMRMIRRLCETQEAEDAIVVFDTKGDYYREFGRTVDCEVIVIGNGKQYENMTRYWNVFGEFMERDGAGNLRYTKYSDQETRELVTGLYVGLESSTQPFFHNAAIDITTMVMIGMAREAERTGERRKLHTCYLARFLKTATREEFLAILEDVKNPDFRSAVEYIGGRKELGGQAQGVLSTIRTMANRILVGIFGDGVLPKELNGREFSMRDIYHARKRLLVFVEYDLKIGATLSPIYRLLFDTLFREALGQQESRRRNLYVMLDEMALLCKLERIGEAVNVGRSLKLSVTAGIQDINQILSLYGDAEGRAVLAGFGNLIGFHVRDEGCREYLSGRFGKNRTDTTFVSMNQNFHMQRDGYCLEDWDIMGLKTGEAAVKLEGESPFLFQFSSYTRR